MTEQEILEQIKELKYEQRSLSSYGDNYGRLHNSYSTQLAALYTLLGKKD